MPRVAPVIRATFPFSRTLDLLDKFGFGTMFSGKLEPSYRTGSHRMHIKAGIPRTIRQECGIRFVRGRSGNVESSRDEDVSLSEASRRVGFPVQSAQERG
jgi:hypothetical protein